MAAPPQPPRQELDFAGRNICSPMQRNLNDIPVIEFDAASGVEDYIDVMERRRARAVGISPATLSGSPVTTTDNPQNQRVDPKTKKKVKGSGASHHIIQISYSKHKTDPKLAVQLLCNDCNGYIIARRVRRNDVWGEWEQFTDIDGAEVPEFLHAQVVDIPASNDIHVTIGGCMESMFYGLVGPVEDKKAAKLALRRAIILFGEAFRLRSILLEMIRRIAEKELPSELSEQAWARIGSWKVLSRFLIELGLLGKRSDAPLMLKLRSYGDLYGLSTVQELIEELLVLRYSDEFLLTKVQKQLDLPKFGMGIKDPKFPRA